MSETKTATLMPSKGGTPMPHGDRFSLLSVANINATEKLWSAIPAGTGWVYMQSAVACFYMVDPTGDTAFSIVTAGYIPANSGPVIVPVHAIAGTGRIIFSTNGGATLGFGSLGYEKGQA